MVIASSHDTTLEFLCLLGRDAIMAPFDERLLTSLINIMGNKGGAAGVCIGYLAESGSWSAPQVGDAFLNSKHQHPAEGPHAAAVRLHAHVASCNYLMLRNNVRQGARLKGTRTDPAIIGAANLMVRDAEQALAAFKRGIADPVKTVSMFRELLGGDYKPREPDGGAQTFVAMCLAGEVLALRDLGRFAEAAQSIRTLQARDRRFDHLLAPLLQEAVAYASKPAFAVGWRKPFVAAQG